MSRTPEFLPLSDDAVHAVSGPSGRHAALIEDAFKVLIETPGGGVTITGDARGRTSAKRALQTLAARADAGDEVVEADVRIAIGGAHGNRHRHRDRNITRARGCYIKFGSRPATACLGMLREQNLSEASWAAVPAGSYECIYANMPVVGLAKAFEHVPVGRRGEAARERIDA